MADNRATTVSHLQKELCDEIERICADVELKAVGIDVPVKLRAFKQQLPIPEAQPLPMPAAGTGSSELEDSGEEFPEYSSGEDENGVNPFPWAIVKADSGMVPAPSERQTVNVVVVIGIYEPDKANNGHESLLVLMERIVERFSKNPLLAKRFSAVMIDERTMFRWSLQDAEEDTYPYFYGALEMAFSMPGFIREDPYA